MLSCRLLGHRFRFRSEGATMRWDCERGCGAGGVKRYAGAAEAARYARALDREDRADLGRRAPLFGALPLRVARAMHERLKPPPPEEERSSSGGGRHGDPSQ